MHTFRVLTSGPPQPVPLCVLIVIGPEVKTQNRCGHLLHPLHIQVFVVSNTQPYSSIEEKTNK